MKQIEPQVKTIKNFITVVTEKPKKKHIIPKVKEFNFLNSSGLNRLSTTFTIT